MTVLVVQKIFGIEQQFFNTATPIKDRCDKALFCPNSRHCYKGFAASSKRIHDSAPLSYQFAPSQEDLFSGTYFAITNLQTRSSSKATVNIEDEALFNNR